MNAWKVKAAGLVAVGMVVSAAVTTGALVWAWRGWSEPEFRRLADGAEASARLVSQLETTSGAQARRLGEIEAAVGDVRRQLQPLNLIRAVPDQLKKPRVAYSVAVLTPAELTGKASDDPAHHLLASVLVNGLADQPGVRVTPVTEVAACKLGSEGREKYPWSGAQEAGQVLGVRFVLTCTAKEKRLGEFPHGLDELYLHSELISVETGALVHGHDWVARQSAGFSSEKPSWAGRVSSPMREGARLAAKKIRQIESEPNLPAVLRGEVKPAGAAELLGYAELCAARKLFAASARLFGEAFAADPALAGDLESAHRYNAACYAARAGCGHEADDAAGVAEAERTRWRTKALEWLRADLALRGHQAGSGRSEDRAEVVSKLEWWQKDPDLAGLRDADALKKLPAEEAAAWQRLWADVEALRQKSR